MTVEEKRAKHRALIASMRVAEATGNSDGAKRQRKSRAKKKRR
ncbi:MAG TPA: hypothetical protein VF245_12915 [Solirubrobacterales bacterium]